jgi:uncharacterized protein (DUF305 family)
MNVPTTRLFRKRVSLGWRLPLASTLVLTAVVVETLTGCSGDDPSSQPTTSSTAEQQAFNTADTEFVLAAGQHLGRTLTAAQIAQTASESPRVQAFARDLVQLKSSQVDQVAGWLNQWGREGADFAHDSHLESATEAGDGLGDATMNRLATMAGPRFDQAFLKAVNAHLSSGAPIWATEVAEGRNPAATKLARELMTQEADLVRRSLALLEN